MALTLAASEGRAGRPLENVLSMEVIEHNRVHYDLTDFLEGVRVVKDSADPEEPLLAHLVEALKSCLPLT